MDRPDKALIVTVLVPTRASDPARNGPWHGFIGTGCAVAKGLILTARHVVQPKNRNGDYPIKIRWYDLRDCPNSPSGWVDLNDNDEDSIRWVGEGNLDAALLACPRPPELRAIADYPVSAARPDGGDEWESRGFAAASIVNGESSHGDFIGKVMSMGRSDPLFSLSSALKTGPNQADWRGASGMPVLVKDTIVGIVKEVPANYENRMLHAVPAFRLRADQGFCKALGYESIPDLLEQAHTLIVEVLRRSDDATDELQRLLKPDCGDREPCRHALADIALEMPLRDLVDNALEAQSRLLSAENTPAADVVVSFIEAVLPTGSASAEVEKITSPEPGSDTTLIRLDVHSPTLAEILMAAADRRGTCFRTLHERKASPMGQGLLANITEGGRDPRGEQRLRDLTTDLVVELSLSENLDDVLFGSLKCVLPEDWQTPGKDLTDDERKEYDQELARLINDELRELARGRVHGRGRFTYYIVSETPATLSEQERDQRDAILASIKQRFRQIAILCTAPRPKMPWKELDPFGNLRALLYNRSRGS